MNFWQYFFGAIIKPNDTFSLLLSDSRQLSQSIKSLLLIGFLYTFTVIGLAIIQADIMIPAWIAIPEDKYYFWEIFFTIPVFTLTWILASGLVQLLSKMFKGAGTFESTAAVLGFALSIPNLVTWIPETIGAVLCLTGVMTQEDWIEIASRPGFWNVFAQIYQFAALAWFIILIWIGVVKVQKLQWWKAGIVSLATVIMVSFFVLIFIR